MVVVRRAVRDVVVEVPRGEVDVVVHQGRYWRLLRGSELDYWRYEVLERSIIIEDEHISPHQSYRC